VKYFAFIFIAAFFVFIFLLGLSEITIGYQPKPELPKIIDDSNMFATKQNSICDCYFHSMEGTLVPANQGTGCNILTMENVNKNEIPVCTFAEPK
jgi:hypothetical protein